METNKNKMLNIFKIGLGWVLLAISFLTTYQLFLLGMAFGLFISVLIGD